jgi:carboxyl-terminal processing protease
MRVALPIAATLLLTLALSGSPVSADPDSTYDKLDVFAQVLQYIQNGYVEKIDSKKLVYGAIRGMLRSLDPHTTFMAPDEFKSMQEDTSGHFGGVGVELETKNGQLVVVAPMDGSPAAIAGIRSGDRILKIDGVSMEEMDPGQASARIKGTPGTKVTLTIDRDDFEAPKDFILIRQRIHTNPVEKSMPLPGYGMVKIRAFQERTDRYLNDALISLKAEAGGELKGLILDLRNNPGGLLEQAVRVVDRFVAEGVIVETRGRGDKVERDFAHKQGTEPGYPLVCLINGGSASASEIVAGALQDHGRALLLGTRSFGKGSVQTVVPLKDGSGLKMTIARYYTPNHRSIQEQGIQPDVLVPEAEPVINSEARITREEDLAHHLKHEPTGTTEQRKLDGLNDYQLRTALTYLRAWERFGLKVQAAAPAPAPAPIPAPKAPKK